MVRSDSGEHAGDGVRLDEAGHPGARAGREEAAQAVPVLVAVVLREVRVDGPRVRGRDIGGQARTKGLLREAVEWPLKHAGAFARMAWLRHWKAFRTISVFAVAFRQQKCYQAQTERCLF